MWAVLYEDGMSLTGRRRDPTFTAAVSWAVPCPAARPAGQAGGELVTQDGLDAGVAAGRSGPVITLT